MRLFCSICKDIYINCSEVHVTNCGHLYHAACLSTWTKQHPTCPQCRTKLTKPFRVYFDIERDSDLDVGALELQVETLSEQLNVSEKAREVLVKETRNLEGIVVNLRDCIDIINEKREDLKMSTTVLKDQLLESDKKIQSLTSELEELRSKKKEVDTLITIKALVEGSTDEVNKMLESTPVSPMSVKHLCTYVGVLKEQLKRFEARNTVLNRQKIDLANNLSLEMAKKLNGVAEIKNLREYNAKLENEILSLKELLEEYKKKNPEKQNPDLLQQPHSSQAQEKKSVFDFDIEILEDEGKKSNTADPDRHIKNWEKMVTDGHTKNFSLLKRQASLNGAHSSSGENTEVLRLSVDYAFDGFGGRKKIKLGTPTPAEEFQQIQKSKKKGSGKAPQNNKKNIECLNLV